MEGKNNVFLKLKPPCVALSQAALALNGPLASIQSVTQNLESLKTTLSSVASKPNALDAKLSEYVFFPISQVLKASRKVSIRVLELCLQCVAILVDQGWRQNIPPQLAAQLVILCTLLADKKPKGLSFTESTDELQERAFWCLYHVFSVLREGGEFQRLLTDESNFPQTGQTISVLLEGIQEGGSAEVQIAATGSLEAFVAHVSDPEIQASFLPGIVSKLTRVLTPQTKSRRNHRVLIGCLAALESLLRNTLGDGESRSDTNFTDKRLVPDSTHPGPSIIDPEWREQAASQLKPAVTNIVKLRVHSRADVQAALGKLCLTLLQKCRDSLKNCSQLALETLIGMLSAREDRDIRIEIEILTQSDSSVAALLQTVLYDWLQSLPTLMQGTDDQRKISQLRQLSTAYEILDKSGLDVSTVRRGMANTLRDSVVVTLTPPGSKQYFTPVDPLVRSLDLAVLNHDSRNIEFGSALGGSKSQEDIMRGIEHVAQLISSSNSSISFSAEIARHLRQSRGETQLANFWLLLTSLQTAIQRNCSVDDFLNLEEGSRLAYNEYLEELYSFSLAILTETSDERVDPRLQALALRALALRAHSAGLDFRYELVDALYPVLHTLATPDEQLQRDSVTTLNIFTSACDYGSVKDLIVDNVDYLTNAVALKLNAFDVSPQAPQVLLMMVRLAGPSLLPYLEDTVESMFAALQDYHGYPLLVELLFKVLSVIAEEGAKTPQLAIENGPKDIVHDWRLERWQPTQINGLAALLKVNAQEAVDQAMADDQEHEPHLKQPWKDMDKVSGEENETDTDDHSNQQLDETEQPPPAPRTYSLLFKITELTQHFLPFASPSLRTSLLSLIKTTIPAIARHGNSFLPLINTLWPEIVSRLDDDEPYVAATALSLVGELCEYAGDFMRTRIIQLWPRLVEISRTTTTIAVQSTHLPVLTSIILSQQVSASGTSASRVAQDVSKVDRTNFGDTSTRLVWAALTTCVTAIIKSVDVMPDIFDEALEILGPTVEQDNVRAAFAAENSDALWLATLRMDARAERAMSTPIDDGRWHFAEIER